MNIEDRLRGAVDARTQAVEPAADIESLNAIEAAIATRRGRRITMIGLLSAAAVVAIAVATIAIARPSDKANLTVSSTTDTSSETTTAPPTTEVATTTTPTTVTPTTAPPTTVPPALVSDAIFPHGASGPRYDSPEFAAKAFATKMLGIPGAYVHASQPTTDVLVRTVRVEAFGDGHPQMTVTVTHAPADDWVVTAASSDEIDVAHIDRAADGSITVSGMGVAFEAQFRIEPRQIPSNTIVSTIQAMGGSMDKQPFTATLPPPSGPGPYALVALIPDESGRGEVTSATVSFIAA